MQPGLYVVRIGEIKREVLLKDKEKRVDFDLTATDGRQASAMEKLMTGMAEMGAALRKIFRENALCWVLGAAK
ncbi:MAG: hypothetical protein LLG20_10365 [Acidobacteriales bacterium]|nr:hypothetical protein [Terriglobales bacterium]